MQINNLIKLKIWVYIYVYVCRCECFAERDAFSDIWIRRWKCICVYVYVCRCECFAERDAFSDFWIKIWYKLTQHTVLIFFGRYNPFSRNFISFFGEYMDACKNEEIIGVYTIIRINEKKVIKFLNKHKRWWTLRVTQILWWIHGCMQKWRNNKSTHDNKNKWKEGY